MKRFMAMALNKGSKPMGMREFIRTNIGEVITIEPRKGRFVLTRYKEIPRGLWNEGA